MKLRTLAALVAFLFAVAPAAHSQMGTKPGGGGGSPSNIPASAVTSGVFPLARGGTGNATWVAGRCVQVSADGTKLEAATDACGTGAQTANYAQSFTEQTSVTLTHNLGSTNIIVSCYDGSGNFFEFGSLSITDANNAAVGFAISQTGVCIVNVAGGVGSGGGGGDVASVFGRTGTVVAASGDYSFSQISGTAAVNQGGTGATTAAGAMVNLLPAYTGNEGRCLKINSGGTAVEWATCASAEAGASNVVGTEASATLSSWGTLAAVGSAGNCVAKNITMAGVTSGARLVLGVPSTLPLTVIAKATPGTDIAVVTLCNVGSTSVSSDLDGTYTVTRLEVLN